MLATFSVAINSNSLKFKGNTRKCKIEIRLLLLQNLKDKIEEWMDLPRSKNTSCKTQHRAYDK